MNYISVEKVKRLLQLQMFKVAKKNSLSLTMVKGNKNDQILRFIQKSFISPLNIPTIQLATVAIKSPEI